MVFSSLVGASIRAKGKGNYISSVQSNEIRTNQTILRSFHFAVKYSRVGFRVEECASGGIIFEGHFANFELGINWNFYCIGSDVHFGDINPLAVDVVAINVRAIDRDTFFDSDQWVNLIYFAIWSGRERNTLVSKIGAIVFRLDAGHALVVFQTERSFMPFGNSMSGAVVDVERRKHFHTVIMPEFWRKREHKMKIVKYHLPLSKCLLVTHVPFPQVLRYRWPKVSVAGIQCSSREFE